MDAQVPLKRRIPPIALGLILALAAYLRLAAIGLAEFKGDEAATSFVGRDLVKNGAIPLVGPPLTTGGHAGPVYYYILAVPFALSQDPVVASVFVVLLNLVGLLVTYRLAKKFFDERVALITSALYAVSPFAILFSRKIWNPDLVFPFVAITMYCLYSFALEKKPRYLIGVFASYAVALQVHPVTVFLAPVLLLFVVLLRRQVDVRHLLLGVLTGLALLSPLVYGILEAHTGEVGSFLSTASYFDFSKVNPTALQSLSSVTSGSGFDYVLGASAGAFYRSVYGVDAYFAVENVLLYAGIAFALWKAWRGAPAERLKFGIIFSWIAVPVVILLFFDPTFGLLPHEVVMFMPANFLAVALLLDQGLAARWRAPWRGRAVRVATAAVLLSIIVVQAFFFAGFNAFLSARGGTAGDYGVGVGYKADAVGYVARDSNGTSFAISSDLSPGNIGTEYYYLLSTYGLTPSNGAGTLFVIVDDLNPPPASLLAQLSSFPSRSFGPLTVYVDAGH